MARDHAEVEMRPLEEGAKRAGGKTGGFQDSGPYSVRDGVTHASALVWLAVATALMVVVVWRASQTQTDIRALENLQANINTVRCQDYNADTGRLTLVRAGFQFKPEASRNLQFLDGFETPCFECSAVINETFGNPVSSECRNINDNPNTGTLQQRRNKNIECGTNTEFTESVSATAVGGNSVVSESVQIGSPTNEGQTSAARCVPADAQLGPAVGGVQHRDLSSLRTSMRNEYWTENESGNVLVCFCQPCGATPQINTNVAGADAACTNMQLFYPTGDLSVGGTTEICVYAPGGNWGSLFP